MVLGALFLLGCGVASNQPKPISKPESAKETLLCKFYFEDFGRITASSQLANLFEGLPQGKDYSPGALPSIKPHQAYCIKSGNSMLFESDLGKLSDQGWKVQDAENGVFWR